MRKSIRILTLAACAVVFGAAGSLLAQTRQLGIDVSQFQGVIDWSTVAKPASQGGGGISFAFVRATRGGTTAAAARVDDTRFLQNMAGAKAAGVLTGAYHFARPDLFNPANPTGPNSPIDEATHFLQVAGDYMTQGYLRPVLDLESGGAELSRTALTDWALAFCAEIVRVKGADAAPIIYVNSSYARDELDSRIAAYDLWLARPSEFPNVQTSDPATPSGFAHPYGVWRTDPANDPHPWAFWQYYIPLDSLTPRYVPGITGDVDLDVVQSERRPLASFIIPEPSALSLLVLPGLLLGRRR